MTAVVESRRVPIVEPARILEAFGDRAHLVAFERVEAREAIVGVGAAFAIEIDRADAFAEVLSEARRIAARLDDPKTRFYGGLSFDARSARFVIPRWTYRVDRLGASLRCVGEPRAGEADAWSRALTDPPPLRALPRAVAVADLDPYERMVEAALDRVAQGLEKIVLRRRFSVLSDGDHRMASLVSALPSRRARAVFAFGRMTSFFAGATPELLVARSDRHVSSEALAGSAGPGEALFTEKNLEEHAWVAGAIRSALLPLVDRWTESGPAPVEVPFLQHLRTTVRATLRRPVHVLELGARLHPTPAVGGVPTDAALSAMRAIEGRDRGPYAGPVGWFDGTGDGELFVALRSASFDGARAEIFAGSGIVRGSSPIREAEETRAKARTIGSVLGVAL